MNNTVFALKGTIIHTPTPDAFEIMEDGYLVAQDGVVVGIYQALPEELAHIPVKDYTGRLIIPGMADIHLHASQYGFRGLGMDLDQDSNWNTWFEQYSLPEESKFSDLAYAEAAYSKFVSDLLHTPTTRLCAFATIHRPATELLMEKLAQAGFAAYVGKVNMDRNSIEGLLETTQETLSETEAWLAESCGRYGEVRPMLTPRYIPSCTDACMEGLQALLNKYQVPVQSHLSEALDEIEWVKSLRPDISFYAQGYDMYGMFGSQVPCVAAHCVYPTPEEFELMTQRKNLWVAHCPQSNLHSTGSAAPIRKYLEAGIHVGLGSDMAGSNTLSLFRAIADTTTASKVYWAAHERNGDPFAQKTYLTLSEAFYLATAGGGALWGACGTFVQGSLFDAVVINDSTLQDLSSRSPRQRIERVIQQADDRHIEAKFISGRQVL